MRRRVKGTIIGFSLTVMMACSFFAGAITMQSGWLLGSKSVLAAESDIELTIFWEAWDLIERRFIDRDHLDGNELSYVAIRAIIEALGDTGHTRFLSPEQAQQHESAMDGRFFGIGTRLGLDESGNPIIIQPFPDSPAARAGLQTGDRLLAVDGENVLGLSIEEIINRVRGEEGTTVDLTIVHPDASEPETVMVTRGEIIIPAVSWAFIPDSKIALIRLDQFSAQANDEIVQALTEAQAKSAEGLIIDVRGNPGGLLDQAIRVTSQFLRAGIVLQEGNADGNRREIAVKRGGIATETPLVVLVNRGSASSSEIFAGAIQDHERGLIVGETTFGTGTVLTPYTLSDGSKLLLGTSEWLTAGGHSIRNQGITPDAKIALPPDGRIVVPDELSALTSQELARSGDRQLLKAITLLDGCWRRQNCARILSGP